jgi:phosphoglycerate dehydrogenase-like enzyme
MDYDRLRELQEKFEENPRRYFAPLANEYRKGGQPKRAIEICRAQLSQMPGHMSGQIVYGQSLYDAGEFDEARQVFENVTFNDAGVELRGETLADFLRGHDKALIALERVDDSLLAQLPELRVIGKYGVGLDGIDLSAVRERGIRLGWTGGVNRRSVAELTIAFAISLLRIFRRRIASSLTARGGSTSAARSVEGQSA